MLHWIAEACRKRAFVTQLNSLTGTLFYHNPSEISLEDLARREKGEKKEGRGR